MNPNQDLNYHLGAIYDFLTIQLRKEMKSGRVDAAKWEAMHDADSWLRSLGSKRYVLERNQVEGFEN